MGGALASLSETTALQGAPPRAAYLLIDYCFCADKLMCGPPGGQFPLLNESHAARNRVVNGATQYRSAMATVSV